MNSMAIPEKNIKDLIKFADIFTNQSNLAIKAYESAMKKSETPEERMYYAGLIDKTRKETQIIFVVGGIVFVAFVKYCVKK